MCKQTFIIKNYYAKLDKIIGNILSRPEKKTPTYDMLDTKKTMQYKLLPLKEKHRQMKIGEIWQEVLGNYEGYMNLKIGHETGLDIISHSNKIIIELKNRTNTDNASSKKSNFDKLAKFKKHNPEYRCIYATINESTEEKTIRGSHTKFIQSDSEIEKYTGHLFLSFILKENTHNIIEFVRTTIDKYLQ